MFQGVESELRGGQTAEEKELTWLINKVGAGDPLVRLRQARAVAYLRKRGRITRSDYMQLNGGLARTTAQRDLLDLNKLRVVEKVGAGKSIAYKLTNE